MTQPFSSNPDRILPNEAIVLAGGLGTRLRGVVSDLPKPMAPVGEKPFLEFVLRYLHLQGIRRVVLSVGYLNEKIQQHFGNEFWGMQIRYSIEETPLGTGGGIKLASEQIEGETCFVVNGDTFFDVPLIELHDRHVEESAILSLALKPMTDIDRYGTVETESSGRITAFREKGKLASGLVNGGIYAMETSIWKETNLEGAFSFEKDLLETQTANLALYGFAFDRYFIDIGIPEDYQKAQNELKRFAY